MIKLSKNLSMLLILFMAISVFILSCDDDGAKRRGRTEISGNINVVGPGAIKSPAGKKPSILARINNFITFAKDSIAQLGESVEVDVFQNGTLVDSVITDDLGNYMVEVPEGGTYTITVSLLSPATESASVVINVTPSSTVDLDLTFITDVDPPTLEIDKFDISSPKISTREVESFPFDEPNANLTIDGEGGNCIKATGNSNVDIKVQDLTLNNCEDGVIAEDLADVRLEANATPTLNIDANNDGISAADESLVRLIGIDIFVKGGKNGILATGVSEVIVDPSGDCIIEGGVKAVDQRDLSTVDTDDCERIEPVIPTPTPTPIPIVTPTPTPTPIPIVTPTPTPIPIVTPTPTPIPIVTPTPTPTPVVTPTPTPTPTPMPTTHDVSMLDNFFEPKEITIKVGDTVRWTNNGILNHTTQDDADVIWNSNNQFPLPGGMAPDDVFQFTFTSEDTFPYYCLFHGAPGGIGMAGTVTVE